VGPGDTVLVAPGVYHELSLSPPEGVVLRGAGASPEDVVIDGEGVHRPMVLGGTSAATVVENLTLRGGTVADQGANLYVLSSQSVVRDCVIENGQAPRGAGVWIGGASAPPIERVVIRNNTATADGAGVLHAGGSALFVDCDFTGNMAEERGGGIRVDAGTVRLEDCHFEMNYGGDYGGGVDFAGRLEVDGCTFVNNSGGSFYFYFGGGAGLRGELGELHCVNSTFDNNNGGEYGGAILLDGETSTTLTDCLFLDNYSRYDGALTIIEPQSPVLERLVFKENGDATVRIDGEGVTGTVRLRDCLFHDNWSYSGLVVSYWQDLILDGCTIVENRHSNFGFLRAYYSTLTLYGCLVVGNGTGDLLDQDTLSGLFVDCTNIIGNTDGDWTGVLAGYAGINGNLSTDPFFCDVANDDFTLEAHSSCLPANNTCGALIGAYNQGCDAVTSLDETTPARTRLVGASPNPFNPATRVDFELAEAGRVELTVFDATGRRLRTLLADELPAGPQSLRWKGGEDGGGRLASGVYFLRFETAGRAETEKLVLLK